MPKMKTHRGAAKRFRYTGQGRVRRVKAYKGHLLAGKSARRKRNLRKATLVSSADRERMQKLLPYG